MNFLPKNIENFSLHLATHFIFFVFCSTAYAQDFLPISDVYSCGRLADGKLQVVKVTSGGFQTFKKGAVVKAYEKDISKLEKRIGVLNDLKTEVKKGTFDGRDLRRLADVISNILEENPDLTTKGSRLLNIANATSQLKQRIRNIKIYIRAVSNCEKQKFPGIDNTIGATVVPHYVQGASRSAVGFLITVPKPSPKTPLAYLCLKNNVPAPIGEPQLITTRLQPFGTNICSYNQSLIIDGALRCDGVQPGLLGFFLGIVYFFGSVDPGDIRVTNALAQVTSVGPSFNFQVLPTTGAPRLECKL